MRTRLFRTFVVLVPGLVGASLIALDVNLQCHYADAVAQVGTPIAASLSLALGSLGGFVLCFAVFTLFRQSKDRGRLWRVGNAVALVALTLLLLNVAIALVAQYWVLLRSRGDAPAETSGDTSAKSNRWIRFDDELMGGNVGMLADDGQASTAARMAQFVVYDAFGNEIAQSSLGAGLRASFAWRGREGSAKDIGSNLVYMQNRHYDPSIGRFIQADDLLLASMTTQGMNRYIYTENDPVSFSDPSGMLTAAGVAIAIIGIILLIFAFLVFFNWFFSVGQTPQRCITELDTSLGDLQTMHLVTDQLPESLPPGVSLSSTSQPGVPTTWADAVLNAILKSLGWANSPPE